jgi:hypothetical protein
MRHRFPVEARCLGRDRRRGLALITYPTPGGYRRDWFADAPATRAVEWYDDAMDRDSRETTTR